jgi:hypothetical protein
MSGSAARVGCSRRRATGVPEEWPSRADARAGAAQNPAYRPADAITRGVRRNTVGRPANFAVRKWRGPAIGSPSGALPQIRFENLADGMSFDEILDAYPNLERDDAVTAIEMAC